MICDDLRMHGNRAGKPSNMHHTGTTKLGCETRPSTVSHHAHTDERKTRS